MMIEHPKWESLLGSLRSEAPRFFETRLQTRLEESLMSSERQAARQHIALALVVCCALAINLWFFYQATFTQQNAVADEYNLTSQADDTEF